MLEDQSSCQFCVEERTSCSSTCLLTTAFQGHKGGDKWHPPSTLSAPIGVPYVPGVFCRSLY